MVKRMMQRIGLGGPTSLTSALSLARSFPPRRRFHPSAQRQIRTQWQGGQHGRPQYNRFQRAADLRDLWRHNPLSRYGLMAAGGLIGVFYVANLEKVPVGVSLL